MITFCQWINENKIKSKNQEKKKGKSVPIAPTATSSPLRGANQDQSGFNVSRDTADYTISD